MFRLLFILGAAVLWTLPVAAQLPRLDLPDAVGLEGHTKEIIVDLDTRDLLIDGYSFDVCHDAKLVSVSEDQVIQGVAIEDLEFDTHVITVEDDGWSVAAVLAKGNSVGEDEADDLELYVVTYDLLAVGETELLFCGDLEEANTVVDGEDNEPILREGSIDIRDEGEAFRRGDADGDGVVHPVLDGFRLRAWGNGFADDPPCMAAADVDGSGAVSSIVDSLLLMNWGVGNRETPPADPGPDECGPEPTSDLDCETLDTCLGDGPTFRDDVKFTFSLSEGRGDVGDEVEVRVAMSGDEGVMGYLLGVCHGTGVSLDDAKQLAFLEDDSFLYQANHVYEGGWVAIGLVSIDETEAFDVSDAPELVVATYTVESNDSTTIEFCETLGDAYQVPTQVVQIDDGVGAIVVPTTVSGGINLPVPENDFLRGDANTNGEVDAISDGLFLLRWGFIDGPAPECDDAADVNDDGEVVALTDALRLLKWGFLEGDPPGDPGITTCGPDPESDRIGCAVPATVCE